MAKISEQDIKVRCTDCDWEGTQSDLINSMGLGDDRYVEGEECPKCESKEIEDVENKGGTMRVTRSKDTKLNLCDFCPQEFATCPKATVRKFGDGIGNDNVIACSEYTGKTNGEKLKDVYIGEIVPKKAKA